MTANVVEQVADLGVGVTKTFLAQSPSTVEVLKSATLLQSLSLNALILGPKGTGKKTLATFIFPNAPIVSALNFSEVLEAIHSFKEVIIVQFEKIANIELLKQELESTKTRIIGTSSVDLPQNYYDPFFSLTIEIPPLSERPEDIEPLCKKFIAENRTLIGDIEVDLGSLNYDLSENAHSLKRSVIMSALMASVNIDEIMHVLEHLFFEKLDGEHEYRDLLYIFDVPLIKAGLKRYKSQLKLSEMLGINRNTLRKKILEYSKELDDE